jgi:hypothetical protein
MSQDAISNKLRDLIAAEADAAEEDVFAPDDHSPLPAQAKITRGHNRSKVLQVRLNGDEFEHLEMLAKAQDLPVSTVARSLILTALAPTTDTTATITRIERELSALKQAMNHS